MKLILTVSILSITILSYATVLPVGPGKAYSTLESAANVAQPGDTILLYEANYNGGDYIENLQGSASAWITIMAVPGDNVVYSGGSQAFQLSDPAYLIIKGLVFEEQTGNGVNIDDAGTFGSPAHHIIIENCEWRSMNANGNNDELKLSGVDDFIIRNCTFKNGADGGSLIDMVGCHNGLFEKNQFENAGSNSIQAKGGSKDITIVHNYFQNAGQRAINIGGSTDLQFFRPLGAAYEASTIHVYANIFRASEAPIAYVGAVNCDVINNTIIEPEFWVIRILQENTSNGMQACGQNIFRNNIVVFGNTGKPAVNIGPNTAPETFTFSNDLWYNPDNLNWAGPNLPVTESNQILNIDPQFSDALFHLKTTSPAIGNGYPVTGPTLDYFGESYKVPRSIGAAEGNTTTGVTINYDHPVLFNLLPNPTVQEITILNNEEQETNVEIFNNTGQLIWKALISKEREIDVSQWAKGLYVVKLGYGARTFIKL